MIYAGIDFYGFSLCHDLGSRIYRVRLVQKKGNLPT